MYAFLDTLSSGELAAVCMLTVDVYIVEEMPSYQLEGRMVAGGSSAMLNTLYTRSRIYLRMRPTGIALMESWHPVLY